MRKINSKRTKKADLWKNKFKKLIIRKIVIFKTLKIKPRIEMTNEVFKFDFKIMIQ